MKANYIESAEVQGIEGTRGELHIHVKNKNGSHNIFINEIFDKNGKFINQAQFDVYMEYAGKFRNEYELMKEFLVSQDMWNKYITYKKNRVCTE